MSKVQLVEVGPRDGFQSVGPFIPTQGKIEIVRKLYQAGIRRMEVTSFVSQAALPQMSDAAAVLRATEALPGLDAQVLVPNARYGIKAFEAGARHLSFVVSASEAHNQRNVKRSPAESVAEYARLVEDAPADARFRFNIATSFDCPFSGAVDPGLVLKLAADALDISPGAELALCDTTGRATPANVQHVMEQLSVMTGRPDKIAFHGHDTYGLGAANALAAHKAGVRIFDASIAGLGGCPFAPGATGNSATEDLAWMFEGMGVLSDVRIDALVRLATEVCKLPGSLTGGRVRAAELARAALATEQ